DTTTTTESGYTGTDTDTTTTTESGYTGTDTDTTTTTESGYTGTDTDTTTTESGTGTGTGTTDTTGSGTGTGTTTTETTFNGVLNGVVRRIYATVSANDEGDYGFYYSYEKEFHREQVKDIEITVIYTNDTEEVIKVAYDFASTPAETFVKHDVDFKYNVTLIYDGDDLTDQSGKVVLAHGDVLKTVDDNDASVVAYIGYRGDVNLDYDVNSVDATQIQVYYAELSTGKNVESTILSISNETLVTSPSSIYDQFAAFLSDVNMSNQEGEIVNWRTGKKGRTIDAVDATCIMVAYAQLSTIDTPYKVGDEALWDYVLAE
ncbi:MAG: hypothetical protein K2J39_09185, partial [Ruminococcus sp.]|nr:hypothetical protein [Ruminococcus sp.]